MANSWHPWKHEHSIGSRARRPCRVTQQIKGFLCMQFNTGQSLVKIKHKQLPPLNNFLELNSWNKTTSSGLNTSQNKSKTVISHFLKKTQETSFEEHLCERYRGKCIILIKFSQIYFCIIVCKRKNSLLVTKTHLSMAKLVLVVVNVQGSQQLFCSLSAVNKLSLRDGRRI